MDQPAEQRLASWWSLKTSNFQTMFFTKDHQGLWKSKEISAPRHCFCYCSRCYPALNPMRGNLMATVLWQKATTFQYISIHFDTFSWFCTQPWRKEESDKVVLSISSIINEICAVFTNSVHFSIQFYSLDCISSFLKFRMSQFLGFCQACHFSCLVNRDSTVSMYSVKGLKCVRNVWTLDILDTGDTAPWTHGCGMIR